MPHKTREKLTGKLTITQSTDVKAILEKEIFLSCHHVANVTQ